MFQFGLFLIVIILVASSLSCSKKEYTTKDDDNALEWMNTYKTTSEILSVVLEEIEFFLVSNNLKSEYINRLEHTQYVVLGEDEYLKLTGKNLEKNYGLAVRAVRAHCGGSFMAFIIPEEYTEYVIWYGVMGRRVWERAKEVLIIEADEFPKEIFIGYSVTR
jgi:hypothetical protein